MKNLISAIGTVLLFGSLTAGCGDKDRDPPSSDATSSTTTVEMLQWSAGSSAKIPDGVEMEPYNYDLEPLPTGGVKPYTFSVHNGALPTGLVLSPAGVISGTPTMVGSFEFQLRVVSAGGGDARLGTSIVIANN